MESVKMAATLLVATLAIAFVLTAWNGRRK